MPFLKSAAWWPGFPHKIRSRGARAAWVLFGVWIAVNFLVARRRTLSILSSLDGLDGQLLERNKRFIFMDHERRLAVPKGTSFNAAGVLSLPFLGDLKAGYGSSVIFTIPLTVDFDELNLSSCDNRFGIPKMNLSTVGTSMGSPPSNYLKETLQNLLLQKEKRSTWAYLPGVNYPGGDREMIFQIVEDILWSLGLDGKGCVMRAVCEMHEVPLVNYGFFGEIFNLILSPSLAAFAEHRLGDYLMAEKEGKEKKDCSYYRRRCKYSLFSKESLSFGNHHRQKRIVTFDPVHRIVFPPTTLAIVSLSLTTVKGLPKGYEVNMTYSIPFKINFDDLGLTSAVNAFGQISLLKSFDKFYEGINYEGGDREMIYLHSFIIFILQFLEMMYAIVADALNKIGINGEACLLRVICEIHEMPLHNHGLFGEILHLFLTPSLAPIAVKRLGEFLEAEEIGKGCAGDCDIYFNLCPFSLFTTPSKGARFSDETKLKECKRHHSK